MSTIFSKFIMWVVGTLVSFVLILGELNRYDLIKTETQKTGGAGKREEQEKLQIQKWNTCTDLKRELAELKSKHIVVIPYVSTVTSARLRPNGLFLLAPAFYLNGYSNQDPTSLAKRTMIVHGWGDEVVPAGNSVRFAGQQRCSLHLLEGDHRLNRAMPQIEKLFEYFLNQDVES